MGLLRPLPMCTLQHCQHHCDGSTKKPQDSEEAYGVPQPGSVSCGGRLGLDEVSLRVRWRAVALMHTDTAHVHMERSPKTQRWLEHALKEGSRTLIEVIPLDICLFACKTYAQFYTSTPALRTLRYQTPYLSSITNPSSRAASSESGCLPRVVHQRRHRGIITSQASNLECSVAPRPTAGIAHSRVLHPMNRRIDRRKRNSLQEI